MSISYDDIIIGAGSAGAVLAARLTEDPARRVLVLEAGPDYRSVEEIPASLRNGRRIAGTHDWGFVAEMVPGRNSPYARGKTIGGSSSVNASVALRGAPQDYDEWAAWGNDEWAWERVLPFFRRLEDDQDVRDSFHGTAGPIPVRRWRDEELIPAQRAFLDAGRTLGFPVTTDHNAPDAIGIGLGPANLRDGVRVSTAIGYLLPARQRPNLTIRGDCLVDRVLFDGTRAVGVTFECNGRSEEMFGHRITLASGAIGSPAILLRSGIGPRADLNSLDIAPVVDLPGVGANLIDHPMVGFRLMANDGTANDDTPFWQVFLQYTAPDSAEWKDMQITVFQGPQQPALSLGAALLRPRSRGVLRLADRDPHTQPDIRLNLAADPEDARRLGEGIRLLCALATTPPMTGQYTGVATLKDGREMTVAEMGIALSIPGAMADYVRQTVSHYVHPVGTARMGADGDTGAVVDQYCRVRGVDGLRVVDAAVMPNVPRANTNLTCIMIGERVADWMQQESKGRPTGR